jgi:biotin carboxyl carrier protein
MKLETVVKAPVGGLVREILAGPGDRVEAADLLVVIDEEAH